MRNYDAVNKIVESIVKSKLVAACFLKGSIARKTDDVYSNIDLYCIIDNKNKEEFLKNRIAFLETYKPLLFVNDANFNKKQLIGIFEDGIHIDLYTITVDEVDMKDEVMILYDPKKLLLNYKALPLALSKEEFTKEIDRFSYLIYEFYNAYKREDLPFSMRIASNLHTIYTKLLRYTYDYKNSALAYKGFIKVLPESCKKEYMDILKLFKTNTILEFVKAVTNEINIIIKGLPIAIISLFNYDFFNFVMKMLYSL